MDTALTPGLISAAIDNLFDDAVLISTDTDFVPVVELVQNRTGRRVIHAQVRPQRQRLLNAYWSHIFIDELMAELLGAEWSPTMRSIDPADVATDTSGKMIAACSAGGEETAVRPAQCAFCHRSLAQSGLSGCAPWNHPIALADSHYPR